MKLHITILSLPEKYHPARPPQLKLRIELSVPKTNKLDGMIKKKIYRRIGIPEVTGSATAIERRLELIKFAAKKFGDTMKITKESCSF